MQKWVMSDDLTLECGAEALPAAQDCETIVSTYSNLDNHPVVLDGRPARAPRDRRPVPDKIVLSAKNGEARQLQPRAGAAGGWTWPDVTCVHASGPGCRASNHVQVRGC